MKNITSYILVALLSVALYAVITSKVTTSMETKIDALEFEVDSIKERNERRGDSIDVLMMQNAGLREKIRELNSSHMEVVSIYEDKINKIRGEQIDAYGVSMDTIAKFISEYYRD